MLGRSLLATLLLGSLMACTLQPQNSAPVDAASSPSSTTSIAQATPQSTQTTIHIKGKETGLSQNSQLALRGIGAIQIGMTVAQASKAIGQPLIVRGEPAPGSSCSYVSPQSSIPGLTFMVIDDRIARIDVRRSSPITTLSGARIGDSEARIQQLYPGQIRVTPHKYLPNGHYLTFTPKDAQDRNYRLIFETDGKQVTDFRSGRLPEVEWVEGCG